MFSYSVIDLNKPMQNLSNKNNFHLHENEILGGTHFHVNGFARRLVLAQTQKPTQKWHIRLRARDVYEVLFCSF